MYNTHYTLGFFTQSRYTEDSFYTVNSLYTGDSLMYTLRIVKPNDSFYNFYNSGSRISKLSLRKDNRKLMITFSTYNCPSAELLKSRYCRLSLPGVMIYVLIIVLSHEIRPVLQPLVMSQ